MTVDPTPVQKVARLDKNWSRLQGLPDGRKCTSFTVMFIRPLMVF